MTQNTKTPEISKENPILLREVDLKKINLTLKITDTKKFKTIKNKLVFNLNEIFKKDYYGFKIKNIKSIKEEIQKGCHELENYEDIYLVSENNTSLKAHYKIIQKPKRKSEFYIYAENQEEFKKIIEINSTIKTYYDHTKKIFKIQEEEDYKKQKTLEKLCKEFEKNTKIKVLTKNPETEPEGLYVQITLADTVPEDYKNFKNVPGIFIKDNKVIFKKSTKKEDITKFFKDDQISFNIGQAFYKPESIFNHILNNSLEPYNQKIQEILKIKEKEEENLLKEEREFQKQPENNKSPYAEDLKVIQKFPDILSIEAKKTRKDEINITIITKDLKIKKGNTKRYGNGGNFEITFKTKNGNLWNYEIKNISRKNIYCEVYDGYIDHPHMRGGECCLGTAESSLRTVMSNNQIIEATFILLEWIKQSNLEDTWGRIAEKLPEEEEPFKIIETTSKTKNPQIILDDLKKSLEETKIWTKVLDNPKGYENSLVLKTFISPKNKKERLIKIAENFNLVHKPKIINLSGHPIQERNSESNVGSFTFINDNNQNYIECILNIKESENYNIEAIKNFIVKEFKEILKIKNMEKKEISEESLNIIKNIITKKSEEERERSFKERIQKIINIKKEIEKIEEKKQNLLKKIEKLKPILEKNYVFIDAKTILTNLEKDIKKITFIFNEKEFSVFFQKNINSLNHQINIYATLEEKNNRTYEYININPIRAMLYILFIEEDYAKIGKLLYRFFRSIEDPK